VCECGWMGVGVCLFFSHPPTTATLKIVIYKSLKILQLFLY
jgi:hypothetical protein